MLWGKEGKRWDVKAESLEDVPMGLGPQAREQGVVPDHLGVFRAAAPECTGTLGMGHWTQTKAIVGVKPSGQQLTIGGRVFVCPSPVLSCGALLEELTRIQPAEKRSHLHSLNPRTALPSSYRRAGEFGVERL